MNDPRGVPSPVPRPAAVPDAARDQLRDALEFRSERASSRPAVSLRRHHRQKPRDHARDVAGWANGPGPARSSIGDLVRNKRRRLVVLARCSTDTQARISGHNNDQVVRTCPGTSSPAVGIFRTTSGTTADVDALPRSGDCQFVFLLGFLLTRFAAAWRAISVRNQKPSQLDDVTFCVAIAGRFDAARGWHPVRSRRRRWRGRNSAC